VIVDEFQDIAHDRANLLKAIRDAGNDTRLFCVGDDWQSIYRFTGSDIGIIRRFADHFGHTRRVDLDTTFRFNKELLEVSRDFVLMNPTQIRRNFEALTQLGRPAVTILFGDDALARAQSQIRGLDPNATILYLGRYKHDCSEDVQAALGELSRFSTIHGAKGMEADHVVILNGGAGRYGFPSEIEDDPIVEFVLPTPEECDHAEERRLFYVALTRARNRVFLIANENTRSTFIDELIDGEEYDVEVDSMSIRCLCTGCDGGTLMRRRSNDGNIFFGCSNYPFCTHTERACTECQDAPMVLVDTVWHCPACKFERTLCPMCKRGMLMQRTGGNRPFEGCSRWRADGTGCPFTRNV
jgi:DNA helicase-4